MSARARETSASKSARNASIRLAGYGIKRVHSIKTRLLSRTQTYACGVIKRDSVSFDELCDYQLDVNLCAMLANAEEDVRRAACCMLRAAC